MATPRNDKRSTRSVWKMSLSCNSCKRFLPLPIRRSCRTLIRAGSSEDTEVSNGLAIGAQRNAWAQGLLGDRHGSGDRGARRDRLHRRRGTGAGLAATAGPHHRALRRRRQFRRHGTDRRAAPHRGVRPDFRGGEPAGRERRDRRGGGGAFGGRRLHAAVGRDAADHINPALTHVNYDPIKDFAPISAVGTNAFVLLVNKDFPPRSVAEFVAFVRGQPTRLAYAEGSAGSLTHLAMALFLKRAGLDMTNVSYRGNAPALTDVVAGHLPTMFSNISDAMPQAAAGSVRLLAVSSKAAAPQLPDVPT